MYAPKNTNMVPYFRNTSCGWNLNEFNLYDGLSSSANDNSHLTLTLGLTFTHIFWIMYAESGLGIFTCLFTAVCKYLVSNVKPWGQGRIALPRGLLQFTTNSLTIFSIFTKLRTYAYIFFIFASLWTKINISRFREHRWTPHLLKTKSFLFVC